MRLGGTLAGALGLVLSCAGARSPEPSAPSAPLALPSARAAFAPPRLFPPTKGAGVMEAGVEHDGSRRLLAFGLRVVQRADGSLEVGDELLPAARSARFAELPARLGSGYLFWIVSSSGTLVYRAESWTAKLTPLAQLDFEAERFVPGFDRLLVLPKRDADYRALDLQTGEPVPPIGLPAAPAYGAMAFVDGWFGAVQVPLRGVLLSFDAGASWHPLGMPVNGLEVAGDALALSTPTGDYLLDPRGELSHVADRDPQKVSEMARAELQRAISPPAVAGKSAESLLELAVQSGFPDGAGNAFVATGGALLRVALQTGRVVERRERAYATSAECQGVRLGTGVGFVCGQGRELTRVYRVNTPLGLSLVRELAGARAVSDSGSGALVLRGGCEGASAASRHCILRADGTTQEVPSGGERDRVVALADGRVVVVTPPGAGAAGSLAIWQGAAVQRVALSAATKDSRQKSLLEQGVWLDGMVEAKPGVLSGWVVGAGPFAGVELSLGGKVTLRRTQDNAGRVLFAGNRALSLGENGLASETTDGGGEWQAVELPPETDVKSSLAQGLRQGCSAVGCSFAGFVRVGWFDGRAARSLAMPQTPARVSFPGPGGSRWRLQCNPTGDVSAPALPFRAATSLAGRRFKPTRIGPGEDALLAPLSPFLEQAPPTLNDAWEGVDAGTEPQGVQLRLYAYGPRGGDWTRAGSLGFSFADRFATLGGVRRTALARSPWPDAATAADALGAEPSTNAAGLAAALDPGGSAGALLLNSRGTLDLFVFEAGRVPLRVPNVGRLGVASRLSGFVKTKAGYYFGSYDENARVLRVYRVAGQDLEVALEVSDIPPPRGPSAELTRSANGDALGIWVRGTGWFVHPVDLETSSVDAPYVVTPAQLAVMPEPCADGAEGLLVTGSIGLDPSAEVPPGFGMRSFEGRFRVSSLGICIDALAAQGEAGGAKTPPRTTSRGLTATGRPTVIATLTERKPLGRRVELRCSN
ncbi:MAG: hypothetical protein K0R38_3088 [Polyangiaceae bacterium]|jgi:hypothetical protein|nr:hypothetical protein [Polyangiaceae bacterium]